METVVAFNTELSGLYETKPPISKAKMTSITRSAMKAIKFYKHVVQSVEKFISKCKQEYKIPGLYVIDSIVRQSRHQFGTEKDVFAPRFARNMQTTFANLFQCSPEDKSKIIRVLNLWQKNNVFAPDVIQPLFDLANPNHPIYQNQNANQDGGNMSNGMLNQDSPPNNMDEGHTMSSDMSGPILPSASQLDSSTIRQLQQLQQLLIRQTNAEPVASTSSSAAADSIKFNKKLLDYDYGDDEDDDKGLSPRQSQSSSGLDNSNISQLLNDPNVLRQLQNLQKLKQQEEKQSKLAEMRMQEEAFEKHLATVLKKLPFANECDLSRQDRTDQLFGMQTAANLNSLLQQQQAAGGFGALLGTNAGEHDNDVELVSDDGKVEIINLDGNSRSPSLDRDRYKRRRSRSRSRDRGNRDRRRRSRSRSPRGGRITSRRDRDRGKERDRERKRKGLPEIKREMLSVCSTTLWIGHLSKLVQQEELSDTFGKYGDIVTIDMIIPRGCAFIAMHRRQDAYKAIDALKNHKLGGRAITISWAPGKGVKSKEWKEYWDLETGVSYIPWSKLDESVDFEALEEGGMIDEESAPAWLIEKLKAETQKKEQRVDVPQIPNMGMFTLPAALDTSQPPPTAMPMVGPPMVPPFGMPARFMTPIGVPINMPIGVPPVPPPMNGQLMMPGGMVPGMPPNQQAPNSGPFIGYFPMPQMTPIPQSAGAPATAMPVSVSAGDDHMDIEMEDESKPSPSNTNNQPNLINPMNMFNRPPPQMFPPTMPPGIPSLAAPMPNAFDNHPPLNADLFADVEGRAAGDEHPIRDERDFRGRGRDRDGPGGRGGSRDNRNREFGSNDRNSRWQEDRDFNRTGGGNKNTNNRDRDRRSNDRDRPLHDRLRENATAVAATIGDPNARGGNGPWPPLQPPGFGGNLMDMNSRRNVSGIGGQPPALEDLDIPVPIEAIRSNLGGKGRFKNDFGRGGNNEFDRRGSGPQGRDFYGNNRFGGPPNINGPMGGRGNNFGPRNNSPMFGGMWNRNAGMNPTERFFERDVNNRDSGNSGGRGNSSSNDNRRGGGRQNKGRGNGDEPNESGHKSSRWGNASPKSNVSEENWDGSSNKKAARKSVNNRNRNDSNSNETNNADKMSEAQAGTANAANPSNKSSELLNDPTNPALTPVRPIRLLKDQNTPSQNDTDSGAYKGTAASSTDGASEQPTAAVESSPTSANATSNNSVHSNSSHQLNDTPKPHRRPRDANTTPLYDEPEESRKSFHNTTPTTNAPSESTPDCGSDASRGNGSSSSHIEKKNSVSVAPVAPSHQPSTTKESNDAASGEPATD